MTLLLHCVCVALLLHMKCLTGQDVRCAKGQWQCDDGSCIPQSWRCDKDGDCLDGSDELDCPGNGGTCARGQLACVDSPGCVNRSDLCDGRHQCFSGSDEANCTATVSCLDSDWTCLNGLCISKELRCNGKNDCLDKGGSDERDCGSCEDGGLRCPEGMCVSAQERCDGKAHCSDASDEPTTCGGRCYVANGGCSHVCVDEPWGALCACPPGFTLADNGAVCTDVDECAQPFPTCGHYCSNTVGSFYCDCKPGFKLNGTTCLATGNPVMLLTQRKGSIVLLNPKSQRLLPHSITAGSNPVCLTYDLVRNWFYWADRKGAILKSDGRRTLTVYTGEPGIKSLACDWLNGYLYWTNEKTHTIYMGSPDRSDFTTVLSKDIRPRELVLLPVESSMFWTNAGPGNATTLERSWMDGSEPSTLAVLTAQGPHSLTIDVAARRLYWLSVLKMSVETVKVDGTGRHSITGKLGSKHPFALAVFGGWFYWVDQMGAWAAPQNQLGHKIFLQNAVSPMLTVYHELQQPKGPSPCEKSPCQLCQLTNENQAGFTCACSIDQVLMPDMPCDYPRFLYGSLRTIHQLEFKGSKVVQTLVFSPKDVIVSFAVDFYRDWIYWVNETGEIKRTPLADTQDNFELIPTITPVCRLRVDQKSGALYWMSCDQTSIGVTGPRQVPPKVLYRTSSGEVRDMYVDWMRARLLWLEADRVLSMSLSGGSPTEVLKLGGDVHIRMAFDLQANSLLWHTGSVGLSTMSLLTGRTHLAGGGWNISGSVVAAFEPFLLSVSSDNITLWDRRDRRRIRDVKRVNLVLEVMVALKDIKPGKTTVIPKVPVQDVRPPQPSPPTQPACPSPSVLCPRTAVHLCISPAQLCNGRKDCPDGFDEENCVKRCPSMADFRCKDRRSCVSKRLLCDGRSHCHDGSDELDCPSIAAAPYRSAAPSQSEVLKCRKGSRPCRDGRECVLYSHECDGDADCQDGSDEQDCYSPMTGSPAFTVGSSSQSRLPDTVATQPRTTAKPRCIYPSFLCPGSPVCISSTQLCDKKRDCPDGADEKNCVSKCPNRSDFRCKDRRSCVSKRLLCDGRSHCHDGSDELNCPSISAAPSQSAARSQSDAIKCRKGSRPCRDGRECVLYSHECDGDADCQDGSDEQDCDSPVTATKGSPALDVRPSSQSRLPDEVATQPLTTTTTKPRCIYPSFLCPGSSLCISSTQLCDKKRDCPDGADEKNCVSKCPNRSDFRCKDRRSCVSRGLVCDGRSHCHDGSDELDCPSTPISAAPSQPDVLKCRRGSRPCRDGRECVLFSHVCDGDTDCPDGSDEEDCPDSCKKGEFQCSHGKRCIPLSQVCDGAAQCLDNSDELDCWKPSKSCQLRCDNKTRCVPASHLCDGERDCRDGADENGCVSEPSEAAGPPSEDAGPPSSNPSKVAGSGSPSNQPQEAGAPPIPSEVATTPSVRSKVPGAPSIQPVTPSMQSCAAPSVRCPLSPVCISQSQLCDGQRDCPKGTDERGCLKRCRNPNYFLCKDKRKCVPPSQKCDGRSHCPDGSDEKECSSKAAASYYSAPSASEVPGPLKCRVGSRPCKDGTECVLYSHVCDGETDCKDGSDEEGCTIQCQTAEFQCAHGRKCIPKTQVCDGTSQCQDRSDELGCKARAEGCHHHCDNATRCVPENFLCDGERDCADGSDEDKCGLHPCGISQFRCASGQCISEALRCDGYADCRDHSDEVGCSRPPRCPPELRCPHSHQCIMKDWFCDGEKDCQDGADEKDCAAVPVSCKEFQWKCGDSNQCIPLSWRCDGQMDCHNGIDENKCSRPSCPPQHFQCSSGECLKSSLVCNGITNCPDSSDEGVGCTQSNCSSSRAPQCGHQCISTPQGPRCSCTAGFKLKSNGISCIDIDECNEVKPAVCQHFCSNTRGSYVCHCYHGFLLEPDNISCKSQDEPLLLASVQSQLLLLGVHSSTMRLLSLANRPVFSLDYDWSEQRVYWLSSYESIRWANLNDTNSIGTLFKGVKPDVIALDWVGRNLYWIDGLVAQILAVSLSDSLAKPQNYTVILDEELEQPSSLVLIPNQGLMLWSEIGSAPQIGRAGMDGTRRQVIVNKGLSWPVSLTFDFLDNRVYWADEKLRCIGSTSLDGQGVKILQLAEMASPFAVEVFNNRVFWSDTKRRTIRSADKNTGKNQKVLLKRPGQPFALRLIHPLSQPPVSNPCHHIRCSHLCVLSPANKALPRPGAPNLASQGPTAVCRCPPGLSLSQDKVTCALSLDATFLLLLSSDTVTQVYLRSLHEGSNLKNLPSMGSRVLGLPGMSVSTGLDAVVDGMSVYVASSGLVTQLRLGNTRSRQGLTPVGRILRLRDDVITAMAVDWETSNLYWSSSKLPLLHVTSSHYGYTIPLLQGSLQGTTSIALHPPAGRLCYSVIRKVDGSSRSQIECAFMDGRNWQLLWDKSNIPTSVVFSSEGTDVFWADIGDGTINSIGLDGSRYRQYKTGPNLVTFTRTDNILLWITREKGTSRVWYSNNTEHKELWFEVETSFVTMKSYSRATQSGSNSCMENNGGCQHLCLAHPEGRTCRCDQDFRPMGDTACVPLPPCTSVSKSCWDGSRCFLYSRFCDGHVDCADMSDEVDCPNKISMASDKPNAPSPDLKTPSSSSPPPDVRTDSKPLLVHDSSSCDLQLCSGHGSCVPEVKETRCHCDGGYEGANCEQETRTSHAPLVLGLMVLVISLAVIVVVCKKRRSGNRNPSIEKETLMTDMGPALPGNLYDPDMMEDLDSPVDAFVVREEFREPPLFDSVHPK